MKTSPIGLRPIMPNRRSSPARPGPVPVPGNPHALRPWIAALLIATIVVIDHWPVLHAQALALDDSDLHTRHRSMGLMFRVVLSHPFFENTEQSETQWPLEIPAQQL